MLPCKQVWVRGSMKCCKAATFPRPVAAASGIEVLSVKDPSDAALAEPSWQTKKNASRSG